MTERSERLDTALSDWATAIGSVNVITDRDELESAEAATFRTRSRIPAILRPGDREEVQACLEIANHHRIPIYPVSTGRNWGYGSMAPAEDGCVVAELSRLDRIVEFSEELAYVTVEPGVTQRQLYDYLAERGSGLWMDATGSSPDCSIVGNALERGFGHTPFGDHFAHVFGMEVVLASGERLQTGFGGFANAQASRVYKWGVGPYLDGLFTQSNYGVVTEVTIALMPAPETFQAFYVMVKTDAQLEELIERLRPLRLNGTIKSSAHIGNGHKVLSSIQRYPWERARGRTPLPVDVLHDMADRWDFGAWNVSGALYGSRQEVALARRRIRNAMKGHADRLRFLGDRTLRLARRLRRPYRWVTGVDIAEMLRLIEPLHGLKKGVPTETMLPSVYWRKQSAVPEAPDPDRDRCGLIWCSPVAPTTGKHARAMADIVHRTLEDHGFEPIISMTLLTERCMDNIVGLTYDRDSPGEDERAMRCYEELVSNLVAAGYYPYRLPICSMEVMAHDSAESRALRARLKSTLDPNHILAPGRYDH